MWQDSRLEIFFEFDRVLLRYNIASVALYLINYNIDISSEKSFCRLLNIYIETVNRFIQVVLWFRRFENLIKFLAKILTLSKTVLNCALKLQCQIKTIITLVELVAQFDFGAAGRPNPVFVIWERMHSANFLELLPELVLANLTIELSCSFLIYFS